MALPKGYARGNDDRCGNCGAYLKPEYKYCVICGTKRGEGEFKPVDNLASILYGPPYSAMYKCKLCGRHFPLSGLGYPQSTRHCPECGGESRLVWDNE